MRRVVMARTGWALAGALVIWIALTAAAGATTQVDCNTPDDFCTGNPCITTEKIEITVAACVLNFAPRALVLADNVEVPDNGLLSLTAASIEVEKKIDGKHTGSGDPDGSDVTLIATGNITVHKRIDTSGRSSAGTILLDAGGNVDLQGQLRARAKGGGATATGGAVTLQAVGSVTSIKKGKIDVRGKKNNTGAGQVTIGGLTGVTLNGRIDARGAPGGTVIITCPACDVTVDEEVRAQGWRVGGGGSVSITAGGDIDIPAGKGKVMASGDAPAAGTIILTAGNVVDANLLKANGTGVPGGTVAVTAAAVEVRNIVVNGKDAGGGGIIDVESTGGDVTLERLLARSPKGVGGTARVDSAGSVTIENARLNGKTAGAGLRVSAVGNLNLGGSKNSDFQVSGTGGGVIEGLAGGNLVAKGNFKAGTGGCVGLDAVGTITTTLASFDVTVTASCP